MYSSEPLPHFVDDYLEYLRENYPTAATFDGVHTYDDLIEDLSRSAIEHVTRDLGGFARRLDAMRPDTLTETERLDRPVLEASIRGRLFDLEEVRTWERDPRIYPETLAVSLAAQTLFQYAPMEERARRVLSKLRQSPRVFEAARNNVKDPPGIFVKAALEALRGLHAFIERDLPRALAAVEDLSLLGDLADASTEATRAIDTYSLYLESEVAPKTKGSFRLGVDRFQTKLRLEEGIDVGVDRLLALAERELERVQQEFQRVAGRLGKGSPSDVWQTIKARHPLPGALAKVAGDQVGTLKTFIERNAIVSVPATDGVIVAPTPPFYRWTFASLWTPGPFESKPLPGYYYVTDVDPTWPPARQDEHLRDFSYGTLWAISMHEVYPGHFLHFQHLRQVDSKHRRSILFAPMSFVEGWAHYSEEMMIAQGFGKGDEEIVLGQLSESLVRLARLIVGIRLHTEDLSVEQGVRFFRDEAYVEESSARREAERGTFDPSYVVYSLGKLMLRKLRRDVEAKEGSRFALKAFHDKLLGNGLLPFWAHRRLMLGESNGTLFE